MLQCNPQVQPGAGGDAPPAKIDDDGLGLFIVSHRFLIVTETLRDQTAIHLGDEDSEALTEIAKDRLGLIAIRESFLELLEVAPGDAAVQMRAGQVSRLLISNGDRHG